MAKHTLASALKVTQSYPKPLNYQIKPFPKPKRYYFKLLIKH